MQRRRWLLAGAGAWLAAPVLGQPTAAPRVLRDGLGLNVRFAAGQPMRELGDLAELGVRWVRDTLPWRQLEPRAGELVAPPPAFLQRLRHYRSLDIGVVCVLSLSNERAYPARPDEPWRSVDPQAFGAHAAAMARLLSEAGLRFVLEIGNEPHNGFMPKLLGGDWSGQPPSPWVRHYVAMCEAAVKAVRAVDPAVRLLSDDDMWITHYRYLDAGLPAGLDGLAVHPYGPTGPELTTQPSAPWMRPYEVSDGDRRLASAVRRLQAKGRQHWGRTPSIWFTEWGWAEGLPAPRTLSEGLQAARLWRAFVVAEAAGVEVLCWYSARDLGRDRFGLVDAGGRRRLAFTAMRQLARELGDWQLLGQVLGQARPTAGPQAFLFGQGGRQRLVAWQADEQDSPARLAGALAQAVPRDALGRPVAVEGAASLDGAPARAVTLSALPWVADLAEPVAPGDDWSRHVRA